jgi:hypothetical protein
MTHSPTAVIHVSATEFITLSEFERFGDGSGYRASLAVAAGSFEARGRAFYFDDLAAFVDRLKAALASLSGTVTLGPSYEPDKINFEFLSCGHVEISGELGAGDGTECSLKFRLKADQTYVAPFLAELQRIGNLLGISSVRTLVEQIHLVGRVGIVLDGPDLSKQRIQRGLLEHGQAQDL